MTTSKSVTKSNDVPIDENVLKEIFGNDNQQFLEILHEFISPSWQIIKEIRIEIIRTKYWGQWAC